MNTTIEVANLKYRYHDGTEALRGVDLDIQRGEIFGLLGPNGAGKTTLLRMLGTIITPTSDVVNLCLFAIPTLGLYLVGAGAAALLRWRKRRPTRWLRRLP